MVPGLSAGSRDPSLSGSSSRQGNAIGINECWYTRADSEPVQQDITGDTI
jgi:hypothetical protein